MLKEAKVLHSMVKDLQNELIPLLAKLEQETILSEKQFGISQADTAYACRETVTILKDLITKINKVSSAAKIVANKFMMLRNLSRIKTEYCTASPKPRLWYKITTKRDNNPEAHDILQTFCGVPQEIAEKEVLRIHPPNFMSYLTELIGEGRGVPVDTANIQQTEFDLSIRSKKEIESA